MLLVVMEGWNEHHFIECTTITLRWSPAVSMAPISRQHKPKGWNLFSAHVQNTVQDFTFIHQISMKHYFLHQTFFFRRILNIFDKDLFHENRTLYKICTWEAWKGGEKWDLRLMKVSEYREIVYKFFAVM